MRHKVLAFVFIIVPVLALSARQTMTDRQRIESALVLLAPVEQHLSGNTLSSFRNAMTRLRNIKNSLPPDPVANVPPAVTLTTNGSTFTAPASITLTASALDSDGTVAKVEFFAGIATLGEDVSAPFTFAWSGVPAGTYSLSARATDNAGATASSAVVSVVVNVATPTTPDPISGPHAYFESLLARSDCWKAFSLRPLAGQDAAITTCGQARYSKQLLASGVGGYAVTRSQPYYITYCPTGSEPNCTAPDTHPQKQDAAKLWIPMFAMAAPLSEPWILGSDISSSDTTITLAATSGLMSTIEKGNGIKIGNEIMVFPTTQSSGRSFTVQRGAFGTQATSHAAGSAVLRNTNSLLNQVFLPTVTNGLETATYLFVWDAFWTDSFVNSGLQVHKTFHFNSAAGDDNWFRADAGYQPYVEDKATAFVVGRDVGVARGRRLFSGIIPPTVVDDAHKPMLPFGSYGSAPIIKPNTWTRWWIYFEFNAEGVLANFTNTTVLSAAIISSTQTTIGISCPAALFGPNCPAFTAPSSVAGASWPGRSLRIDNEILTITSGASNGDVTTLTVVRGAYGTAPQTHDVGADVGLVHDYITMYFADEQMGPVQVYNRFPTHLDENTATASLRGALLRMRLEFNTSEAAIQQGRLNKGQEDLVAYLKNVAILKNPPADWLSQVGQRPIR